MKKEFIAHRRKTDGEPQSLCSHLSRVAVLSGKFAFKIGLKEAGRLIGLLHDLGKVLHRKLSSSAVLASVFSSRYFTINGV